MILRASFSDATTLKTSPAATQSSRPSTSTGVEGPASFIASPELLDKANELLLQDAFNADFNDPTMEEDLVNLNGITNEVLSALSSNNIKKLEDLAEMSVGELQDISDIISEKEASALIMEARKPWFE